jgi:hypothetical protein
MCVEHFTSQEHTFKVDDTGVTPHGDKTLDKPVIRQTINK